MNANPSTPFSKRHTSPPHAIAEYVADLVVDDRRLVELKSTLPLALLLNFQHSKVVWQRVVHNF